jgi:hypothetical protein
MAVDPRLLPLLLFALRRAHRQSSLNSHDPTYVSLRGEASIRRRRMIAPVRSSSLDLVLRGHIGLTDGAILARLRERCFVQQVRV